MAINLQPQSASPVMMEEEEYQRLVARSEGGWSQCASEREWLAKLHYLRQGLAQGKLAPEAFEEREDRLVLNWLHKAV